MPALTRRRSKDARAECWQIFYHDVQVGTIGTRAGVPVDVDQWGWSCGFYPGSEPSEYLSGTAATFDQARTDFGAAWPAFLAKRTDADFTAFRRHRDFAAWKYAMWDAGCRMPTQVPELRSRCFCGAEIGIACEEHVYARHMEITA
jgi:hypothetical protein